MIKLQEILKVSNYEIISGAEFLWQCYGIHARFLDFSFNGQENVGASCIFDTNTEQVYEVTINPENGKEYRWIDPEYIEAYKIEADARNVSFEFIDEKEKIKWVYLEDVQDVFSKFTSTLESGTCDDLITIPLDCSQAEKDLIEKAASLLGISVNDYLNQVAIEEASKILGIPIEKILKP